MAELGHAADSMGWQSATARRLWRRMSEPLQKQESSRCSIHLVNHHCPWGLRTELRTTGGAVFQKVNDKTLFGNKKK